MHKSKNYDMATQVAMDKLMPKPIQITISMQGGGGLRGLGERPISSVYGRPIPRTIYRDNGGPIIRRFMGGYSDVDAGVEEVTGVSNIGGEGQYPEGDPYTYYQGVTSRGPTPTPIQPSEEAPVYPAPPRDDSGGEQSEDIWDKDRQQALDIVVKERPRYLVGLHNKLKEQGYTNKQVQERLVGLGMSGLAKIKEGRSYEGILSEQAKAISKTLQEILADDEAIRGANIDEDESGLGMPTKEDIARYEAMGIGKMEAPSKKEIEKAGLGGIWESIKQTIGTFPAGKEPQVTTTALIEDAVQKIGGKYEAVGRDPSVMKGIINFLTPAVGHLFNAIFGGKSIGTITRGGVTYNVNEEGVTTPVSFATSSIYADNEPVKKRRRRPQPVARPSTLEPEAPAKGTMKRYYADLGPAATREQGLRSLTREGGPLSQVYTKKQIKDFNLA